LSPLRSVFPLFILFIYFKEVLLLAEAAWAGNKKPYILATTSMLYRRNYVQLHAIHQGEVFFFFKFVM
jgi:hypothetical protein